MKKRRCIPKLSRFFSQLKLQMVFTVLTLSAFPTAGLAQEPACTYDLCALRMAGKEIKRGVADERVARLSFWGGAPELEMLSGRADSVGINYEAFRKLNNRGVWLEQVGLAASLAGLLLAAFDEDNVGWGVGLVLAGNVPLFWGASDRSRARDRLHRAIWWYNRDF